MPGSIGEEDDIQRGIKRRSRMYDMMSKDAESPKTATGKLGNKKVNRTDSPKDLDKISLKRFKTS